MTQLPDHKVELIWDDQCPNADLARERLRQAFVELDREPQWKEWHIEDPDVPAHAANYGSPTILVDGRDVSGESTNDGCSTSCRVYSRDDGKLDKAPPVEVIVAALSE